MNGKWNFAEKRQSFQGDRWRSKVLQNEMQSVVPVYTFTIHHLKKKLTATWFQENNSTVTTNSSTALVQSSEAQVTGWLWEKICFGVQPCQKSHGFPAKQAWHNHNQHNLIHFSRKELPVTKIQLNTFQPYCPPFFLNPWKSLVGSRSCPFGNFHLAPFCPQKTLDVTWLIYQNSYN